MTVKTTTAIDAKNISNFEKLWSWLRDVDDALNYDPQEQLHRSHEQLTQELSDLQVRVKQLEKREKQER